MGSDPSPLVMFLGPTKLLILLEQRALFGEKVMPMLPLRLIHLRDIAVAISSASTTVILFLIYMHAHRASGLRNYYGYTCMP